MLRRRNDALCELIRSQHEEFIRCQEQLQEGTKQIQANTRAVLSVLDRLDAT